MDCQWPSYDPELVKAPEILIVVQVNGKVRDKITVPLGTPEERIKELALEAPGARRHTEGKQIRRIIYVPDKLVNIVCGT